MVIGNAPYQFIAEHYKKPVVIAGFEPLDILQSVWMLLKQLAAEESKVQNQYSRIVPDKGNRVALQAISEVFELRAFFEWRGLGSIDHSGVRMKDSWADYDAEVKFVVPAIKIADPKSCQCGEVLKGAIKPWDCKVFGKACTPETPVGALMVSSEGACAAYYQYGDKEKLEQHRISLQEIPVE
jgi:hydrogenase expression/formation protein HypD